MPFVCGDRRDAPSLGLRDCNVVDVTELRQCLNKLQHRNALRRGSCQSMQRATRRAGCSAGDGGGRGGGRGKGGRVRGRKDNGKWGERGGRGKGEAEEGKWGDTVMPTSGRVVGLVANGLPAMLR